MTARRKACVRTTFLEMALLPDRACRMQRPPRKAQQTMWTRPLEPLCLFHKCCLASHTDMASMSGCVLSVNMWPAALGGC